MSKVIDLNITQTEYFERTHALKQFYDDIRKYEVLSKEDELRLYNSYKNGSPSERQQARDMLILSNQRFVIAMAKRYGTNDNILDLISEGNKALIDSLESFDPSKEARFTTYAVWYIRRELNNYCIKNGNLVRKNNLPKTYHIISRATNKFIQEEFRQPTPNELLEILQKDYDISLKSINDVLSTKYLYIDDPTSREDSGEENTVATTVFNSYTSYTNDCERSIETEFNKSLITSMLNELPEREQKIIKWSFGIGLEYPMDKQDIGKKLGMSGERVRQLKESVLSKLQVIYKEKLKQL